MPLLFFVSGFLGLGYQGVVAELLLPKAALAGALLGLEGRGL